MYHEKRVQVEARDTDLFGLCRPSSLLDFLQETATEAADILHVGREEMIEKHHMFWMLARMWYRLDRPLFWKDVLTVRTWHRGSKGASMYRDFDLFREGESVGEAVSVWVLADFTTHRLCRLETLQELEDTSGGSLCKTKLLPKLRLPGSLTPVEQRFLHYSDCDINGHVNNVRYADFACDALRLDQMGSGSFVSSVQLGYLKECRAGESLRLSTGTFDGTWYVQGDGPEERPRFDAALTLSPLDNPRNGA